MVGALWLDLCFDAKTRERLVDQPPSLGWAEWTALAGTRDPERAGERVRRTAAALTGPVGFIFRQKGSFLRPSGKAWPKDRGMLYENQCRSFFRRRFGGA